MKNFLIFISKVIIMVIFMAFMMDYIYTFIFSKSIGRNKIENVINTRSKSYDVLIMGSSRANNHIVPKLFADKGLTTFNYGIGGLELQENALLLELMLANNYQINNLILQVDININGDENSFGNQAKFMPFIKNNPIISNYYKDKLPDFKYVKFMPFYRYIEYDAQIGFREMFFALIKKHSYNLDNYGFSPLFGSGKNMSLDLSNMSPKRNLAYEKIKMLCEKYNIKLISITTPVCENTVGMNYFSEIKNVYPEILNFEDFVVEDKYFSSCGHMNDKGAKLFTRKIVDVLELKK